MSTTEAIKQLQNHQTQLDADGTMVGVSRQALEEVLAALVGSPTHRHVKRGSEYVLIGIGKMQAENWEEREYTATDEPVAGASVDMREVAIYRDVADGSLWARPREEFEDGRFQALIPPDAIVYWHGFKIEDGCQTYAEDTSSDPATGWCVYAVTELPGGERPCHFEQDYTTEDAASKAALELAEEHDNEVRRY